MSSTAFHSDVRSSMAELTTANSCSCSTFTPNLGGFSPFLSIGLALALTPEMVDIGVIASWLEGDRMETCFDVEEALCDGEPEIIDC